MEDALMWASAHLRTHARNILKLLMNVDNKRLATMTPFLQISNVSQDFAFNNEINRLFITNYWQRLMVLVAKYGDSKLFKKKRKKKEKTTNSHAWDMRLALNNRKQWVPGDKLPLIVHFIYEFMMICTWLYHQLTVVGARAFEIFFVWWSPLRIHRILTNMRTWSGVIQKKMKKKNAEIVYDLWQTLKKKSKTSKNCKDLFYDQQISCEKWSLGAYVPIANVFSRKAFTIFFGFFFIYFALFVDRRLGWLLRSACVSVYSTKKKIFANFVGHFLIWACVCDFFSI